MRIDILTLFPSMFSPLEESIIGKAKDKGIIDIAVTDIRSFAKDKHKTADDTPCGGGAGMVMKPDLIFDALGSIKKTGKMTRTILLSPSGRTFDQEAAKELAKCEHLIFICGHYEDVDERVKAKLVTDEISIGDYCFRNSHYDDLRRCWGSGRDLDDGPEINR